MAGTDGGGEGVLELGDPRTLRDPSGGDRLGGGRCLLGTEPWAHHRDHPGPSRPHSAARRCSRHHATSCRRPSARLVSAFQPSRSAARETSASRRVTALTPRGGPNSSGRSLSMARQQGAGELDETGLGPAADVEDLVGQVLGGGEEVGAGNVLGEDEVHRLGAVTEDERRLPRLDPLHPPDQHLGVEAVDVHPRAVHVEVTQGDVVEAAHCVETAEQAFVEGLGRAVEGVVRVRVVPLSCGEPRGEPVHRGRRRGDHLADTCVRRRLDDFIGAVDEDLEGEPGLLSALRDPYGRLMEDQVHPRHDIGDLAAIPDISLDDLDLARAENAGQVLHAPANEVVEDDDVPGPGFDELVHDGGADGARAARHEAALSLDHSVAAISTGTLVPPSSALRVAASSSFRTRMPARASVSGARPSAIALANSASTAVSASRSGSAGT